ncbi:magnesium transporter CorA family protein [Propionivibrio dicarboxylicus]|uniref:Mg2+ and Co2+ transporter CorA n=1 Tax=Propionivibrio dicarboxylicus TaxID=83767 RepID=A0A1G8FL52_9RHOO|nr:magnesium transporter CorA family protein [Propionivibrio dicarboxylicus]SDH82831.1 Mg2+ and Co2+ transporter CorA [Propionivibrio dicarboxylicus]
MRILSVHDDRVKTHPSLDTIDAMTDVRFVWISCTHDEFGSEQRALQQLLATRCGAQIVDLHVSDLLNPYLPSHYDFTYDYELLVFRRLASSAESRQTGSTDHDPGVTQARRRGPSILGPINTRPVGFVVFDRLLLTLHPRECPARDTIIARLLAAQSTDARARGSHPPSSPGDLMLRIINLIVDDYLGLRRELTLQIDRWQTRLLDPRSRFSQWSAMLEARLSLQHLDEICEDQRAAIQDWDDTLRSLPKPASDRQRKERELLEVRSRDVLEHIARMVHHVRRLEQSSEAAVQMHFNAQGNRTNNIMRTLTTLTAIFLPLNLIAAIFGMNFDSLPLIHQYAGFWWAVGAMALIAVILCIFFWRKNYLSRSEP